MISRRRTAFVPSASQLVVSQILCGFIENLKRARVVLMSVFYLLPPRRKRRI